ncbi:hypothetical protein GOP47_0015030, partial [Adiantum capillus-veneris]
MFFFLQSFGLQLPACNIPFSAFICLWDLLSDSQYCPPMSCACDGSTQASSSSSCSSTLYTPSSARPPLALLYFPFSSPGSPPWRISLSKRFSLFLLEPGPLLSVAAPF